MTSKASKNDSEENGKKTKKMKEGREKGHDVQRKGGNMKTKRLGN